MSKDINFEDFLQKSVDELNSLLEPYKELIYQEEIANKINSVPMFPIVVKIENKWIRDFELSETETKNIYEYLK